MPELFGRNKVIHYFKENQPGHAGLERLKVLQLTSREQFTRDLDGITESNIEDATQESFYLHVHINVP